MKDYNKLEEVIKKAVPEIMELKFGRMIYKEDVIEILGRDITLEDVLMTIIKNKSKYYFPNDQGLILGTDEVNWILDKWKLNTPLHLQPDETLTFLIELLVK